MLCPPLGKKIGVTLEDILLEMPHRTDLNPSPKYPCGQVCQKESRVPSQRSGWCSASASAAAINNAGEGANRRWGWVGGTCGGATL